MQSDRAVEGIDDDEIVAEVDAEEVRGDTALRTLGFTDVEIARVRGRASPADLAKPPPTASDIEKDLAEIQSLRQTDKRKYYSDAVQAREAEAYTRLEKAKAADAVAKSTAAEQAETDDEGVPASLREAWAKEADGVEGALAAIRTRTTIAFAGMEDDDVEALKAAFDRDLDDESQAAIAAGLASDTKHPPATEAEVREFVADTEYGGQLVQLWGERAAPAMLGRAKREAQLLWNTMTETSRLRVERWIGARPTEHKVVIIKALAARAARRL